MEKSNFKVTGDTLKALRGESPRERLLHRLHCVAMALNGASASEPRESMVARLGRLPIG